MKHHAANKSYRYDPERWVNPTAEMKDAFMGFGGNARSELALTLSLNVDTDADLVARSMPRSKRSST